MRKEVNILIVEDDEGHAVLIRKNLKRAGITNPIIEFKNGQEVLDFLFARKAGMSGKNNNDVKSYLLLLDLGIPLVDGQEVLRRIKADEELKKISVIIITNNADPRLLLSAPPSRKIKRWNQVSQVKNSTRANQWIFGAAIIFIAFIPHNLLPEQAYEEYQLKAVLLERFARFTEWPQNSNVHDKSVPFIIGVLGKNPFIVKNKNETANTDWLAIVYTKRTIKDKKVEIRGFKDIKDIKECNLLFISASNEKMLPEIIAETQRRQILTVGDTGGFGREGVHINIVIEDDQFTFEVNESAIHQSGFTVSIHLLKMARIVNPLKKR